MASPLDIFKLLGVADLVPDCYHGKCELIGFRACRAN
jgi:hypothetical protein